MNKKIGSVILVAAAVAAIAAPAWADTICTVNTSEIRLRKSPSKKAKVVAVLKKDMQVTTLGECNSGWTKVTSTDGRVSGYLGGWALSATAPRAAAMTPAATPAAAPAATPPRPAVAKVEAPIPVTAPKETPSTEKLAIQITELRLNVLSIERDMDKMNKEIQKIKVGMLRKKGHKRQAKKA
jgi:uncharacterized protein YgiM (DUF1202 family)